MRRILSILFVVALTSQLVLGQEAIDPNDGVGLCAASKTGAFFNAYKAATKGNPERISHATPGFDATHYSLVLDVDRDRDPILQGTVTVTGVTSMQLSALDLDLSDNMFVRSVADEEGLPLTYTQNNHTLRTILAQPVAAGQVVSITIDYLGNPARTGFGSFSDGLMNGQPFVWTLSEPYGAKEWWPNVDHPSDKADSVRIAVTVPETLRAGSNGLLERETMNGDGTATYEWVHRYPIASYLVSLAIGNYDVYRQTYTRPDSLASQFGPLSLPILHYAYTGSNVFEGSGGQSGWNHVVEVLPVYENWFGPYPFPEEKYGHAHVTFGGGMEHQTMTSMGGSGWGLVAHELAHMWFGDMITNKTWPHLWLHEGFATMGELLFWESNPDRYGSAHSNIFNLYYARALTAQGTLVVEDTSRVGNLFASARVYSKGGMVLHMLRQMVGDNSFREILRAYSADAAVKYGIAETSDFERVASVVSGANLKTFFEQWVTDGTGYPSYELKWISTSSKSGPGILIEIRQTQGTTQSNISAFQMPLELIVHTATGDKTFVLENSQRIQSYILALDTEATGVDLDPQRKVLRDAEIPISTLPPPVSFEWNVFPNPAQSEIHVRFDLPIETPVSARLFDATGRLVNSYALGIFTPGTFVRSLKLPNGTASGMYVVEVTTSERVVSQMVAVVR